MYVTEEIVGVMIDRYGAPSKKEFRFDVDEEEFRMIQSSQKNGREHDVTFYIIKDDQIIVIAKHFYPPGLYRAPSGGLQPGEPMEEGIKREAREETGCEIDIEEYLLRTDTVFECNNGETQSELNWHTHVFQARYISGDFEFTDKHEIREVRLATLEEFETFSRIKRQSTIGGLHYRAALHDTVEGMLTL